MGDEYTKPTSFLCRMPKGEIISERVDAEAYQQDVAQDAERDKHADKGIHVDRANLEDLILSPQKCDKGAYIKICDEKHKYQQADVGARGADDIKMQKRIQHARDPAGGAINMQVSVLKAVYIWLQCAVCQAAVERQQCRAQKYGKVK